MSVELLGFIDGIDFNIFFRGLLSTIAMFLVLCGAKYMIIATNTGIRQGMLLASAGFFSWMFMMGVIWTVYGTGWIGDAPTWDLLEIREGTLAEAETDNVSELANVDLASSITVPDPDLAQAQALTISEGEDIGEWIYLETSNSIRGDAQAAVDAFLIEEDVFASAGDFVPLQFGAFTQGGKPRISSDASNVERFFHWFDESIFNPLHSQEVILIQVQAAREQFSLAGDVPPIAEVDTAQPVLSVIMERDRGGPIPAVISGTRFTPLAFTIISGLIFAFLCLQLHNRSQRLDRAVAAAA